VELTSTADLLVGRGAPSLGAGAGRQPGEDGSPGCSEAGALSFDPGTSRQVHVPEEATEAMRDLDAGAERARGSKRPSRSPATSSRSSSSGTAGGSTAGDPATQKHLDWIRSQVFEEEAQRSGGPGGTTSTRCEEGGEPCGPSSARTLGELRVYLGKEAPLVEGAPRLLVGIEPRGGSDHRGEKLGDIEALTRHPRQLMGYLAWFPRSTPRGEHEAGTDHQDRERPMRRRMLVESAWSYRFSPPQGEHGAAAAETEGLAQGVREIAWKAQLRLHKRYMRLLARGKNKQRTTPPRWPELAGFIWAISREPKLLAG